MGYRCPNCGKDFGFDKEALNYHLEYENGECAGYAAAILTSIQIKCNLSTKEGKTLIKKERKRKTYSQISPNHYWEKKNIVSDKEGYDTVVCSKCGIKAKRCASNYKFDMRQSVDKIENCIKEKG